MGKKEIGEVMCAIAFFAKYWAITFLIKKGQVVSQTEQGARMVHD